MLFKIYIDIVLLNVTVTRLLKKSFICYCLTLLDSIP